MTIADSDFSLGRRALAARLSAKQILQGNSRILRNGQDLFARLYLFLMLAVSQSLFNLVFQYTQFGNC